MTPRQGLVAALAVAVAFAAALVAVPERTTIVLGRPGDGPFLTGFGARTTHRGLPGRWTGGLGRIELPASPFPSRLTLQVQALDTRAPDAVEVFVDGVRVVRDTLPAGRRTLTIDVPPCGSAFRCRGAHVAIQSATWRDAASGDTRGLFVGRAVLERGGAGGVPLAAWASALLLAVGLVAATFTAIRSVALAAAFAAWGAVALWLFRPLLAAWWPWLALVFGTFAVLVRGWRRLQARHDVRLHVDLQGRLAPLAFLALAAGLIALLFAEVVLAGEVLGQPQMLEGYYPWRAYLPAGWEPRPGAPLGDVPMLVYPFLAFVRERLLDGHLPLWTASLNAGQPFLAAYQAAVFSPLTWVALIVPLPQATVAIAALRLLVGGLGMFVFVRGLGLSRGAAFLAGTAYLLNPFTVIWLEHPPGGVPPFLPWMLHAGTRLAEGRRFGPAGLALSTGLVLLGGHPHTGLFCAALGAAWAAAAALASPGRWGRVTAVGAALAIGAALAAIQVAPFLEYLFASRGYTWRQFAGLNPLAAPASTLITALVPRFLGEHAADTYAGPLNFLEQTVYAGIPVLLLAMAGVAAPRRDWRALFFAGTAVVAALAVYGAPGLIHLISVLPLVKGATLTRIPIVAITSAIVVAAFGADALLRAASTAHRQRLARAIAAGAGAIAAVVLLTLTIQRSFLVRSMLTGETWRWSLWAILVAAAAALIAMAVARDWLARPAALTGLTLLVALDLLVYGRGLHPTQPADRVYPQLPELTRLRAEPGPFRILGAKGALMPNSALVYSLQDIRAYDGLGVAWYAELLDAALAWAPAHQQHEAHAADSPLLDALGVRYLLAPPDFPVDPAHWERVGDTTAPLYRNRRERPRAYLADRVVVATGNDARRRLRDGAIDLSRETILEMQPASADRPEPGAGDAASGTARITAYDHERVVIETEASGRRLLVLTDTWFPGWRADVDGQPVAIARANFAFRAVTVPAGRHRVTFEYAPASFRIGAMISGVALVLLLGWTAFDERRRRR